MYDEKPTSVRASLRQKIRWAQGHWYVALHNTKKMFRLMFSGKLRLAEFISIGLYMYSLSAYVITLLMVVLSLLLLLPGFAHTMQETSLLSEAGGIVLFLYNFVLLFFLADWMDNRIAFRWRTLPLMLGSIVVSMVISSVSQVVGLCRFRNQHTWVKTEHKISSGHTAASDRF